MNKAPATAETDAVPIGDEEMATHQEAVPAPYLAGTRRVALRWMTGALDRVTQQAPDAPAGKK